MIIMFANFIIRFRKRFMQFLFILSLKSCWWNTQVAGMSSAMEKKNGILRVEYHPVKSLKPQFIFSTFNWILVYSVLDSRHVCPKKFGQCTLLYASPPRKHKAHRFHMAGLFWQIWRCSLFWLVIFDCRRKNCKQNNYFKYI